jgi:hypothetical protein
MSFVLMIDVFKDYNSVWFGFKLWLFNEIINFPAWAKLHKANRKLILKYFK